MDQLQAGNRHDARAVVRREDFGGTELRDVTETAATAVAAAARAEIESAYVMSIRRPRDMDEVRVRLLRDCGRKAFAESSRYVIPRGEGQIEGWTIRFAEAALRLYGNVRAPVTVLYDDAQQRIVQVAVIDLETNTAYQRAVTVRKVVERRTPRKGDEVLSSRTGSSGQTVYTVRATDDELAMREGSLVSKALRTLALRLLPADLLEDALARVYATMEAQAAADPDAERKALADGFARINVRPSQLAEYLGHDLGTCSPAELVGLRGIYAAIRDGATTWAAVMDTAREERGENEATGGQATKLREKIAESRGGAKADTKVAPASGSARPAPATPAAAKAPDVATMAAALARVRTAADLGAWKGEHEAHRSVVGPEDMIALRRVLIMLTGGPSAQFAERGLETFVLSESYGGVLDLATLDLVAWRKEHARDVQPAGSDAPFWSAFAAILRAREALPAEATE